MMHIIMRNRSTATCILIFSVASLFAYCLLLRSVWSAPRVKFLKVYKLSKTKTADENEKQNAPHVPAAVVLFTQMRSGSSVLGEIFNQRSDVTYFYEPLFPFDERPCDSLLKDRVEVLRQISSCQFGDLRNMYKKAFNVSKRRDTAG